MTVNSGRHAILSRRNKSLNAGGKWHLAVNEGATPEDFSASVGPAAPLAHGFIASRGLFEELGVLLDPAQAADITRPVGLFQLGSDLGLFFHVQGERLGWDGDFIAQAHATAVDGWEGAPRTTSLDRQSLLSLGMPGEWTPWGLPCMEALVDIVAYS